jgi:hypothetical protein
MHQSAYIDVSHRENYEAPASGRIKTLVLFLLYWGANFQPFVRTMNNKIRVFTILCFLATGIALLFISSKNIRLDAEVKQLHAELGQMSIDDVNRVHLVEIQSVDIPPEVASQAIRTWQFRCYLPAGYDFVLFGGDGRVTEKGIFRPGGSSSSWSSSQPKATHKLLSIAIGMAYRNYRSLTQQRDELLSLAIRLQVKDAKELASVAMHQKSSVCHFESLFSMDIHPTAIGHYPTCAAA